ncbi:Hydrolase tropI [Hypsizygus marmoreus]|uniref:Hydrolase tropI n=1 Tax=Hypsizygus marmoreus TaxID=39966 RepID=A0A369J3G1_HYPMA|nr:Hydrolase tropI [Hypsizygus marmoreus]
MSYHLTTATGRWLDYEPTGYISTHGAYFSPSPNLDVKDEGSESAVLLLTDAFGLHHRNSRILADELAMRLDCDVWVPDYFQGRPLADMNTMSIVPGVKMTICDWIRLMIDHVPRIRTLMHSRPKVVDAKLTQFIHAIQEEKNYEKIGAVGYGYGGSTAIRLAATDWIKSVVICHPGRFSVAQVKAIKVPSAWLCAEEDMFLRRKLRLQAEAELFAKRSADSYTDFEFRDYPGTTHGFAYRPDPGSSESKAAYEAAFEQTVEWFMKTLVG